MLIIALPVLFSYFYSSFRVHNTSAPSPSNVLALFDLFCPLYNTLVISASSTHNFVFTTNMASQGPGISKEFIVYMLVMTAIAVMSFATFIILLNIVVHSIAAIRNHSHQLSKTSSRDNGSGDEKQLLIEDLESQDADEDDLSAYQEEDSLIPAYHD